MYPTEGSLDESQPNIVFDVQSTPDLIDLHDSFMVAEVKLQQLKDGKYVNPTDGEHVTPSNCTLYSFFKGGQF